MKIILIQPSERMLVGKKKEYGSIMPPLGLLSLAACVREKCKDVEFAEHFCMNLEDVRRLLNELVSLRALKSKTDIYNNNHYKIIDFVK